MNLKNLWQSFKCFNHDHLDGEIVNDSSPVITIKQCPHCLKLYTVPKKFKR